MHEKSLFYQSQVSVTLEAELKEINLQIEKAKQTEESAIQQAKTADKAELAKALLRGESQHFGAALFNRGEYALHELDLLAQRHPTSQRRRCSD